MLFTIRAVTTERSLFYFLGGLFWGITLYTYSMSYVIVPAFLFVTFIILLMFKKLSVKKALLVAVPFALLGIPLFLEQLVMMGYMEPYTFLGITDFWYPEYTRYHSISPTYFWENLKVFFKYTYVADNDRYDANPVFGTLYYVSLPFIWIGLVSSVVNVIKDIREKKLNTWIFPVLFYVVARVFFLFVEYPNINRTNGIYPIYLLFIVYGIRAIVNRINKAAVRRVFLAVVTVAYLVCFVAYSRYFYMHDGLQSDAFNEGDGLGINVEAGEAAALAKKIAAGKPVVAMLNDGYYRHMALALFTETSPYEYNREHEPEDRIFNGVDWHMPDGLDLSGDTVYLIDAELIHITQYLQSEGFAVDITYPDFTVVYR